eukprot:TRINITY_DN5214_c0_g1_i3.p1 TRINITY_DN5214_c0_g1~~TRINITY_DN5214_c0_g1_i3.p1  ORF type:complete len:420 (-),score=107.99 TRINITY_DN5214_c0_g1_i3:411-1670(-)
MQSNWGCHLVGNTGGSAQESNLLSLSKIFKKAGNAKFSSSTNPKMMRANTRNAKRIKAAYLEEEEEINHEVLEEDKDEPYRPLPITSEEFINASYKFVIDPETEDIDKFLLAENASKAIDWDSVLLVLCPVKGKYSCPICHEEELVAPKIAKCGHIICFPCFLQYAHHQRKNDKMNECPLCHALMHSSSLKPCKLTSTADLEEGKELEMCLTVRESGSIVVRRAESEGEDVFYCPDAVQFSRIAVARSRAAILKDELVQLENALAGLNLDETSEAVLFTIKAIRLQGKKLSDCEEPEPPIIAPLKQNARLYAYQTNTGDNIYLHPVNFKCLQDQYKSEEMPKAIKGKVLEREVQYVTRESKRKYGYLSHLPLNSIFTLVELDLKEIIKPEILLMNEQTLMERQEQRDKEKAKDLALDKK